MIPSKIDVLLNVHHLSEPATLPQRTTSILPQCTRPIQWHSHSTAFNNLQQHCCNVRRRAKRDAISASPLTLIGESIQRQITLWCVFLSHSLARKEKPGQHEKRAPSILIGLYPQNTQTPLNARVNMAMTHTHTLKHAAVLLAIYYFYVDDVIKCVCGPQSQPRPIGHTTNRNEMGGIVSTQCYQITYLAFSVNHIAVDFVEPVPKIGNFNYNVLVFQVIVKLKNI